MGHITPRAFILCTGIATAIQLYGQAPTSSKPAADVLIFTDGEKLIGQLESATGSSVKFKSNMAGEVTVDWSKIQELHSAEKFAAIPKDAKLTKSSDLSKVPQGTVNMTDQQLAVTGGPGQSQTIPVGNIGNVVSEESFQKAFQRTSFLQGWKGGATAGISLTEATQKNETYSAVVNLVRSVPTENWLDLRSRTMFTFNEAYGTISQPSTPTVKTSLFHLGLEQDWYVSSRVFVFGQALLDHSYSQGLDLQQIYGAGVGFVAFKTPNQELDFKASMDYINQRYTDSSLNKSLIGSVFGETYNRKFAHGILFDEQGGFTPAWNDTSAYSAFASAGLTFPVYHHFGLTLGALDNFLNTPPPGFKKNLFQFTLGATYSFQ
jgi:uncharacterized protein DUF481